VSKRIHSDSDYFLAGKSMGPLLATFSIFATWFGAESCVGTSSKVFQLGFGGSLTDPFGYVICIFLMGLVFSRILWRTNFTTIADVISDRYGKKIEFITAVLIIPGSLIWAGAQIKAFGNVLQANMSVNIHIATTIAAGVILIYTISGGLLADAYSDLIQGFVLIIGLVVLMITVVIDSGGISSTWALAQQQNTLIQNTIEPITWSIRIETLMVPILGSLMSQELVSRILSTKNEKIAYRSCLWAGWIYLLIGIIPITLGLVGSSVLPGLEQTDMLTPLLAKKYLNYYFYIIFLGALVSAILSTVDSTLLAVSAIATHNLFPQYKNLPEKKKVFYARLGVLVSGLIAYAVAFSSDTISGLVEYASSIGGPIILSIVIFALFTKIGNATNAGIAIAVGAISWVIFEFFVEINTPVILTTVMTIIGYIGVSVIRKCYVKLPFTQATLRKWIGVFLP